MILIGKFVVKIFLPNVQITLDAAAAVAPVMRTHAE